MIAAKVMVTVGALMIVSYVILALVLNIGGPTLYDILSFGGVAIGVVGMIIRRVAGPSRG